MFVHKKTHILMFVHVYKSYDIFCIKQIGMIYITKMCVKDFITLI